MAVTLVTSTAACFANVSPSSVSLNLFGSQLLVVAVGWSSAATFNPPQVAADGAIMTLVNPPVEWDTASGAVAIYTLPVVNPANTAISITMTQTTFIGNVQMAAYAYAGTSQSLGVKVTAEYGTNTVTVSTGTTAINGISAGSVTTFTGFTFFGGTPTAVNASAGWTGGNQATGTNEGVYGFHSAQTGNLSITLTSSPVSNFNMLCIGWEVLAGTPATGGSGVTLVAHNATCLGVISSAAPGSLAFDPTTTATYLVATLGWASSSPLTPPSVTFNGTVMSLVLTPIKVDNGNGAVAIYVLPLSSSSAGTVVVSSTPNFAGLTSIALAAYSNAAHLLGVTVTDEYGTHSSGVLTGTTAINGITAGSAVTFTAMSFFGTTPTSIDRSAGWQAIGAANAANQSVYSFNYEYQTGGNYSITLVNNVTFFNFLCIGYEVLITGTPTPASTVEITASQINYLGAIGLNPTNVTFNTLGADLLVLCAARTNNTTTGPATFTYGGIPMRFLTSTVIHDATLGAAMDIAVLPNPPSGVQTLTGDGPTGYVGDTVVLLAGLSNLSGVVGVRATYSGQGDNATVTFGTTPKTGSLALAFVASPFTKNTQTPNYGWHLEQQNVTGAFVYSWLFSALSSPSLGLYLTNSAFASTQSIVLEFEHALDVTPAQTGTGTSGVSSFVGAGNGNFLAKLTPTGQTFHIYWDSWLDLPQKDVSNMQPDDFYLSRIPDYVKTVCLSFAVPQCTYAGLSSNVKATTGLNFPGSVTLLRDTIALLKSRNPTIDVLLAIQQNTPEQAYPDPYRSAWPGWGGMTNVHIANTKQFIEDCGMDGVVIDYECLSTQQAASFHCTYTAQGIPTCFTDTELVSVAKAIRTGLPRPLIVIIDGLSVGAYIGASYFGGLPVGFNSGYNYCLTQDAAALAAIDGIHIESYDAGNTFDPRRSARAFQAFFPGLPIWIGCRVGPEEFENVKRSEFDFIDYCNTAIILGLGGVHMYSMLWDLAPPAGSANPLASGAPFGNYGPNFPDANVCAAAVATTLNLGTSEQTGASVNADQLRLTNSPVRRGVL